MPHCKLLHEVGLQALQSLLFLATLKKIRDQANKRDVFLRFGSIFTHQQYLPHKIQHCIEDKCKENSVGHTLLHKVLPSLCQSSILWSNAQCPNNRSKTNDCACNANDGCISRQLGCFWVCICCCASATSRLFTQSQVWYKEDVCEKLQNTRQI